jgi:hypothetical protein
MSIAGKPSKLTSAAVWLGLTLALLLGIAGSPFAQSGPGGYGPGPGPRPGGGGMRHGGGGGQMMSRETLEGPPSPAILHDSIGLSGDQLQLYARRYSNYTAETGPVRDSLRTSMQAMRAALRAGTVPKHAAGVMHWSVSLRSWRQGTRSSRRCSRRV